MPSDSGQYNALVQDIVGEAMRGVGSGRDTANEELIARKYNHMVLDGNSALLFASRRLAMAVEFCCLRTPAPGHEDR